MSESHKPLITTKNWQLYYFTTNTGKWGFRIIRFNK